MCANTHNYSAHITATTEPAAQLPELATRTASSTQMINYNVRAWKKIEAVRNSRNSRSSQNIRSSIDDGSCNAALIISSAAAADVRQMREFITAAAAAVVAGRSVLLKETMREVVWCE